MSAPRVLLVDDEPGVLSALRRSLRREGFELLTAEDAARAEEILAEAANNHAPIDLVISDHKMPGMSGIKFLARVRQRYPSCGRILLSGWTSEIPEQDWKAADIAAKHGKPWDDAALKTSIHDALSRKG